MTASTDALKAVLAHSRKAVAIGRNYVDHAAEMGAPPPKSPFWFFKPSTSYLAATPTSSAVLRLPPHAGVHHEVELAAIIGTRLQRASTSDALAAVSGYAVGVDITARAWQASAKRAGLPWARSKGADGFLPLGGVCGRARVETGAGGAPAGRLWLRVNGQLRQDACVSQVTFSLAEILADVSSVVTLEPHDVVLTGTPAGVGPLVHGDVVTAGFDGVDEMDVCFTCVEDGVGW